MQPQIIRLNDLHPDGVRIRVSWEKMIVNASVFIPCIDTDTALKQVKNIAEGGFNLRLRRIHGTYTDRVIIIVDDFNQAAR